jgi:hypothetical protein
MIVAIKVTDELHSLLYSSSTLSLIIFTSVCFMNIFLIELNLYFYWISKSVSIVRSLFSFFNPTRVE